MGRTVKGLYHFVIAVFSLIWFRFPSRKLTVIGVTGTDGKTTTTTLIWEILKKAGYKSSMITSVSAYIAGKSYDTGFHVTTPNAFQIQKYLREAVDHKDTHMVLEVTSHALSQYRVTGIRFAVGVLTNVTHEHMDWHKTFARYLAAKFILLRNSNIVVLNRDEAEVYNKAILKLSRKKIVTYGIRRDSNVTPASFPFTTPLIGQFNTYNCLAAIAAATSLNIGKKYIREALAHFSGVPGRMEVVVKKPFTVIVDFAHTPNAIAEALKTVRKFTKGRIIHVFGSASQRDVTKRPFMGKMSSQHADIIVLTEEDCRKENVEHIMDDIARGITMGKTVYRFGQRDEAIDFAIHQARENDTVIITGKGHEKSLCRGSTEYPWSEHTAVMKAMQKRSS